MLASIVALCSIPAVIAALPVQGSTIGAAALRARIMASASRPFQGYAESTADFGLPSLPDLGNVSMLLDGTTDQYVWYRSADYWRADVVSAEGENDTYGDGGVTYLWNYGSNSLIQIIGAEPVRLPRAADLLPPELARRLLSIAGPSVRLSRLPSRRVAGVAAAGLRVTPTSPGTTIGAIDIWADPHTGLPVEVQLSARGSGHPVLLSNFLELNQTEPSLDVVTPHPAPQLGLATARQPDINRILNGDGDGDNDGDPFPAELGGLRLVPIPGGPPGVAIYGSGLSRLVVLPLPHSIGPEALNAAVQAGADLVPLTGQTGAVIRTPLLSVLMVTAGFHHATWLFAGAVTPAVLEKAANSMINDLNHFSGSACRRRAAPRRWPVIATNALTKRYGRLLVVDQIDLDVREGDRYGFLGPNGSGKTTVVRMLLGLVYATSGEIQVMGKPVPKQVADVLPSIGSLVEGPSAYGHLSGRANLALIDAAGPAASRRTRRHRIADTLDRVGLGGIDNRPVKRYSLGMRQRLGLAAALLRTPRLLILDEPTNGLDPQGIREIRDLLIELNQAGTTVFLSSHQLTEVEQLCTRVGIVNQGRLVEQDELAALRALTGRAIVHTPDVDKAKELLDGRVELTEVDRLLVRDTDTALLNAQLVAGGVRVTEISAERRSLEDVVLAVTGSGSDRVDRPVSRGVRPPRPRGTTATSWGRARCRRGEP